MSLNRRTLVRGLAWTTPVIVAAAPAPAFAASPPLRISTTGWAITASSQETSLENSPATNAFDGNNNTIWHSCYHSGCSLTLPQWVAATSPNPFTINRVVYVPRQSSVEGRATELKVELLIGGIWTTVSTVTNIPWNTNAFVTINFGATYTATGVRVSVIHSHHTQGDDKYASIGEVQLWDA